MSDELERLRKENDTLRRERRAEEEKWREEDKLWKIKMMDKTVEAHEEYSQRLTSHSGEIKSIGNELTQIGLTVNGNPATRTPGLVIEVDRLQQSHKSQVWYSRAAITAGLGSLATWIFGK